MKRVVLAAVAAALVLSGCSAVSDIAESIGAAAVPSIEVGECTDLVITGTNEEVSDIDKVDCADEHKFEVYAEFIYGDDEEYPGASAASAKAQEYCLEKFEPFIGIPYEASIYEVTYLYPVEQTWAVGDRVVSCLVGADAGGITGSLQGAQE